MTHRLNRFRPRTLLGVLATTFALASVPSVAFANAAGAGPQDPQAQANRLLEDIKNLEKLLAEHLGNLKFLLEERKKADNGDYFGHAGRDGKYFLPVPEYLHKQLGEILELIKTEQETLAFLRQQYKELTGNEPPPPTYADDIKPIKPTGYDIVKLDPPPAPGPSIVEIVKLEAEVRDAQRLYDSLEEQLDRARKAVKSAATTIGLYHEGDLLKAAVENYKHQLEWLKDIRRKVNEARKRLKAAKKKLAEAKKAPKKKKKLKKKK